MTTATQACEIANMSITNQRYLSDKNKQLIIGYIEDCIHQTAERGGYNKFISMEQFIQNDWLTEDHAFAQFGDHILPIIREAGYTIDLDSVFGEKGFTISWRINPIKSE